MYTPSPLPPIILHPGTATKMLRAGSVLQPARLQDAAGGVGGSRMLSLPNLAKADPEMATHGQ